MKRKPAMKKRTKNLTAKSWKLMKKAQKKLMKKWMRGPTMPRISLTMERPMVMKMMLVLMKKQLSSLRRNPATVKDQDTYHYLN